VSAAVADYQRDPAAHADSLTSRFLSRIADIAMTKLVRLPRLDHDDDIRQEMLVAMFLAPRKEHAGKIDARLNAFAYLMKTAIRRGNKLLGTLAKKREKDEAVTDYLIDRMRRNGARGEVM